MNNFDHITVLRDETVALVVPRPEQPPTGNSLLYADCTLGGAGHTLRLLEILSMTAREKHHFRNTVFEILCCDQDPRALEVARERIEHWLLKNEEVRKQLQIQFLDFNFRHLPEWLQTNRPTMKLSGLMADLGVSSPQLDEADRGFSFFREGPLDMRMNNTCGTTAKELLETLPEQELSRIFQNYGEEPRSRALAKAIVQDRSKGALPLSNTIAFAQYVARVLGYHQSRVHPATRIFQALRIAVNEELTAVEELLSGIPGMMANDGRVAVISFHSLEDRLVKRFFRAWETGSRSPDEHRANEKQDWLASQMGLYRQGQHQARSFGREEPRGGVTAGENEVTQNPRSRSARLRGFVFSKDPAEKN